MSLKNKHLHTLRGAVAKERFNRIQSIKVFCKKASFKEQFIRTKPIKIKQIFLTPTKITHKIILHMLNQHITFQIYQQITLLPTSSNNNNVQGHSNQGEIQSFSSSHLQE